MAMWDHLRPNSRTWPRNCPWNCRLSFCPDSWELEGFSLFERGKDAVTWPNIQMSSIWKAGCCLRCCPGCCLHSFATGSCPKCCSLWCTSSPEGAMQGAVQGVVQGVSLAARSRTLLALTASNYAFCKVLFGVHVDTIRNVAWIVL